MAFVEDHHTSRAGTAEQSSLARRERLARLMPPESSQCLPSAPHLPMRLKMNETFFAHSIADDAHLLRCWARQDCNSCLKQQDCSWCPLSWTCVPNTHEVQFLAPVWEGDNTCPHWAERWEIRTRPLGCHVSTITTLTSLATVACTLFSVLLIWLAGFAAKKLTAYSKTHPGWWKVWRLNPKALLLVLQKQLTTIRALGAIGPRESREEREPLLPSSRATAPLDGPDRQ
ncbi:hypothetical protein F5Y19DRAFT_375664 [Xylariaceae sp. FL1651]|nr:hypothetical protein F5Y19DRAFT_375664 [Xylariaceae sp. FL1651]